MDSRFRGNPQSCYFKMCQVIYRYLLRRHIKPAIKGSCKNNFTFQHLISRSFWQILKSKNLETAHYYSAFCSLKSTRQASLQDSGPNLSANSVKLVGSPAQVVVIESKDLTPQQNDGCKLPLLLRSCQLFLRKP